MLRSRVVIEACQKFWRQVATLYFIKGRIRMAELSQVSSSIDDSKIVTFPDSPYRLYQPFPPAGDQPAAIEKLVEGVGDGLSFQTLLGVTGSGKTFTMANAIDRNSVV